MHYLLGVFVFVCTCSTITSKQVIQCDPAHYSFAILSDIHIGGAPGEALEELANQAVGRINSLVKSNGVCLVFITGDLTNSAMPWQYAKVREILDRLLVPYIPTLGNHDIWSYNGTWEEKYPTGDALFAETFRDKFENTYDYNNETVYNPEHDIYSWFQNWQLRIGNTVYLSLDWNSREAAVWELGYQGSMPGGEIHDFPGGTIQWVAYQLQNLPITTETIICLQHHPYRTPWYIPDYIYGFTHDDKAAIRQVLSEYQPLDKYWGVFAGHYHIWSNGTAFDEWPSFWQWETSACKVDSAISLVTMENDKVVDIQELYGMLKKESIQNLQQY